MIIVIIIMFIIATIYLIRSAITENLDDAYYYLFISAITFFIALAVSPI